MLTVIERTSSGTFLLDGIEYNEYPAPAKLVKAMKREWAESFK